ncbi:post-transcriptional regulator [Neobacillus sp. Marseille-QA0830]
MDNILNFDQFRTQVQPAMVSKLEEFRLLGYDSVSESGLWDFLTKKKWRKVTDEVKLYQIVDDILSVKIGDYMNFAAIESYKTSEFSLDDENELRELLK